MKANLYTLEPRNKITLNKQQGILNNGADNAYPTRMERLILASPTAKAAAEMYTNFLVGDGFGKEINEIVVGVDNYKPITIYDLLERTAHSIAYQNGAFTQANWRYINDEKYVIDSFTPLIFKHCRLGKPDDKDYSGKIAYYDNWDRQKSARVMNESIEKIDVFNPNRKVIESQVIAAGGWEKYKGQIFWIFLDNEYNYPLSLIDVSQDDADTEAQISVFRNNELNGNLFAKYIIRHSYFATEKDRTDFVDRLKQFQSAKNNGSLMLIEDDISQDSLGEVKDNGLKFEKIEQNINDKLFVEWEKSTANNIRKSFKAIPPVLIDYVEGKLGGTSGEEFIQAGKFYNEMTKKDRTIITRMFNELFKHYKEKINSNFEIIPLNFGTTNIV